MKIIAAACAKSLEESLLDCFYDFFSVLMILKNASSHNNHNFFLLLPPKLYISFIHSHTRQPSNQVSRRTRAQSKLSILSEEKIIKKIIFLYFIAKGNFKYCCHFES